MVECPTCFERVVDSSGAYECKGCGKKYHEKSYGQILEAARADMGDLIHGRLVAEMKKKPVVSGAFHLDKLKTHLKRRETNERFTVYTEFGEECRASSVNAKRYFFEDEDFQLDWAYNHKADSSYATTINRNMDSEGIGDWEMNLPGAGVKVGIIRHGLKLRESHEDYRVKEFLELQLDRESGGLKPCYIRLDAEYNYSENNGRGFSLKRIESKPELSARAFCFGNESSEENPQFPTDIFLRGWAMRALRKLRGQAALEIPVI